MALSEAELEIAESAWVKIDRLDSSTLASCALFSGKHFVPVTVGRRSSRRRSLPCPFICCECSLDFNCISALNKHKCPRNKNKTLGYDQRLVPHSSPGSRVLGKRRRSLRKSESEISVASGKKITRRARNTKTAKTKCCDILCVDSDNSYQNNTQKVQVNTRNLNIKEHTSRWLREHSGKHSTTRRRLSLQLKSACPPRSFAPIVVSHNCDQCLRVFSSRVSLNKHRASTHPESHYPPCRPCFVRVERLNVSKDTNSRSGRPQCCPPVERSADSRVKPRRSLCRGVLHRLESCVVSRPHNTRRAKHIRKGPERCQEETPVEAESSVKVAESNRDSSVFQSSEQSPNQTGVNSESSHGGSELLARISDILDDALFAALPGESSEVDCDSQLLDSRCTSGGIGVEQADRSGAVVMDVSDDEVSQDLGAPDVVVAMTSKEPDCNHESLAGSDSLIENGESRNIVSSTEVPHEISHGPAAEADDNNLTATSSIDANSLNTVDIYDAEDAPITEQDQEGSFVGNAVSISSDSYPTTPDQTEAVNNEQEDDCTPTETCRSSVKDDENGANANDDSYTSVSNIPPAEIDDIPAMADVDNIVVPGEMCDQISDYSGANSCADTVSPMEIDSQTVNYAQPVDQIEVSSEKPNALPEVLSNGFNRIEVSVNTEVENSPGCGLCPMTSDIIKDKCMVDVNPATRSEDITGDLNGNGNSEDFKELEDIRNDHNGRGNSEDFKELEDITGDLNGRETSEDFNESGDIRNDHNGHGKLEDSNESGDIRNDVNGCVNSEDSNDLNSLKDHLVDGITQHRDLSLTKLTVEATDQKLSEFYETTGADNVEHSESRLLANSGVDVTDSGEGLKQCDSVSDYLT